MTIHSLKGLNTRHATGRITASPADRIRYELRTLGLEDWLDSAPCSWLTVTAGYAAPANQRMARECLRAKVDGAVSYAERISADEGRIARERFRDVIDALERLS